MIRFWWFVVHLLPLTMMDIIKEQCDISECNFRGDCRKLNKMIICTCVRGYSGERCEIVENFCKSLSCGGNSTCIDYPGNFNCICKKSSEYSNCTKSLTNNESPPQNVYFLFQPIIRLNEDHSFLLVIESFGSVSSRIEVSTSNYVLINTKVSENNHKMFKLVTDIQLHGIVKRMNFEEINIPHQKVFIATFTDVLVSRGHKTLKLIIKRDCNSSDCVKTVFHLSYYNATVFTKDNNCSPSVKLSSCESSHQPRDVLLNDYNVFKPTIQRSCSENSSLSYQWSVEHLVQEKTMMNLPNERSSSLQLAPFTLLFDDHEDFFTGFYTVKLIVLEHDYGNKKSGMTIWRCFVSVTVEHPRSIIKGGLLRNVNEQNSFILDSTESKDYATKLYDAKSLMFKWSCTSEASSFCKHFKSSDSIVNVPRKSFSAGQIADFHLTVESKVSQKSDYTKQKISFVASKTLNVWMKCVKNCGPNVLNHKMFHAKVFCDDCGLNKTTTTTWTLNSRNISLTSRAVVLPFTMQVGKNIINVVVKQNEVIGESSMIVYALAPPLVSCQIQPQKGIEFITNFTIKCNSVAKQFEVYQENVLIGKFLSNVIETKLKKSNNVVIQVVDTLGAQSSVSIAVEVEKLDVQDVSSFLHGNGNRTSLRQLVTSNNFPSAAVMIHVAVDNKEQEDDKNLTRNIMKNLQHVQLEDNESINIMSGVLRELCEKVEMNHHDERLQVAFILKKLATKLGLTTMFSIDESRNISSNLLSVMRIISMPIDLMKSQLNSTLPFEQRLDVYEDYEEFDSEIVEKMNNLMFVGNTIEFTLEQLGNLLASFIEPSEPAVRIEVSDAQMIAIAGESNNSLSHELHNSTVYIGMENVNPHRMLKFAFISLKNVHPFWFLDEGNVNNSNFMFTGSFNENSKRIWKLSKRIKISPKINEISSKEHSVCVGTFSDMPTFAFRATSSSTVVIKFKTLEESRLKYFTQFNKKPQLKDFISQSKSINGSSWIHIKTKLRDADFYISFMNQRQSKDKTCTNLTLQLFVLTCNLFDARDGIWDRKSCRVDNISISSAFDCYCNKVGLFLARVQEPVVIMDGTRQLFNSQERNLVVFGCVLIVLLIFVIALIVIWRMKNQKLNLVYLKSNHPSSLNYFIITVVTGVETSSKISIEVLGSKSICDRHWLEDETGNFKKKSQRSFLLTTSTALGDIEKICIWIKPFGYNPSWFCEKILVRDLAKGIDTVFLVQKWLSLVENADEIFYELLPTSTKDLNAKRNLFQMNIQREFSKSLLNWEMFVNFKIRLLTTLCIFTTIMSFTCSIYGPTTLMNIEDEAIDFEYPESLRVITTFMKSFFMFIAIKIIFDIVAQQESGCRLLN